MYMQYINLLLVLCLIRPTSKGSIIDLSDLSIVWFYRAQEMIFKTVVS